MLPSFRLVFATFLLSFLLVFASLRLVDSARVAQEPMALARATLKDADGMPHKADRLRAGAAAFELRFAADSEMLAPVPVSLTLHAIDRATSRPGAAREVEAPVPAVEVPPVPESATPAVPPLEISEPVAAPAPPPVILPVIDGSAALRIVPEESAPQPLEPAPIAPIEIAALPEPAAPAASEPLPRPEEHTASIDPDRKPPEPVETAGTTEPEPELVLVPLPHSRPEFRAAAKKHAAKPRRSKPHVKRPAAPPKVAVVKRRPAGKTQTASSPTPFSSLFGGNTPAQ